jgi:riboflavin kinase/FMN adenylyltransferase
MRLLEGPHRSWPIPERRSAVTIGVYDGVHRGHRTVIAALGRDAVERDLALTVVTFRTHPAAVLAPDRVPRRLTTLSQQLELFDELGVDQVAILDFDDALRHLPAEAFVTEVLVDALAAAVVSVGEDFRFGYRQQGDCALLARMGAAHGFQLAPVAIVGDGEGAFTASDVRDALADGDLGAAGRILGRRFAVRGVVVRGDGRGRAIGFPTANLRLDEAQALPSRGVYAVWVRVGDGVLPGVANIGVRPTFDGTVEVLEAHLLDLADRPEGEGSEGIDLYDQEVDVEFVSRIRDEQRFDGVESLVAQIGADVAEARARLDQDAGSLR